MKIDINSMISFSSKKGFATQARMNTHMNIHTGNKPYVCKYCGRGFADNGNARMHERTTHEGYKRPEKAKRPVNSDDRPDGLRFS